MSGAATRVTFTEFGSQRRKDRSPGAALSGATLLVALFALSAPAAMGNEPFIGGYSPVSYFEVGMPELGDPQWTAIHDGNEYWFTSQSQRDLFVAEPERYAPVFGALCPFSLAHGRKLPIDPTRFKIIAGELLLFHQSRDGGDGLAAFDEADDTQAILEQARGEFFKLRF